MSASQHPVANLPLAEVVDIRSERPAAAAVASYRLSGPEKVVPFSVAELVAVQLSEMKDRWQLSLVQRDAVWSQIQARYLLDSLLYGYPIGSLLICRVKRDGNVRVQRGGTQTHCAPVLLDAPDDGLEHWGSRRAPESLVVPLNVGGLWQRN
jgi:hypothetical protein